MHKVKLSIITFLLLFILVGCGQDKTYKITFVIEGENIFSVEYPQGEVALASLPTPNIPTGYEFKSWYYDQSFNEEVESIDLKHDLTLYSQFIRLAELVALDGLVLPARVEADIILPNEIEGYELVWSSSKEKVLSSSGKYLNTSLVDEEVVLTAKIANTLHQKEFTIIVSAYPVAAEARKVLASISFPTEVSKNITLQGKYGIFNALWSSDKPQVISGSGIVKLTSKAEIVTLTLKLSYLSYEETVTFTITTAIVPLGINDYEYFALQASSYGFSPDEVLMTKAEIAAFNATVLTSPNTNTKDLSLLANTISGTELTSMINKYTNMNSYTVYNDTTKASINNTDKQTILNNRNLSNITTSTEVIYAISTTHVNMRSYPTNFYSQSATLDRFQETGFGAGIPIAIYHTSLDGKWYYGRMYNYDGWFEASTVGLTDKETFLKFYNPENFVVITDPFITVGDALMRMGSTLPLDENNKILFPTRLANGSLALINPDLAEDSYNVGYLELNYSNLFRQAYKLLGHPYSWGDKNPVGLDCSSTQAGIYGTFGLKLGRNTSNQWSTLKYGENVSSSTVASLTKYKPGTLFYTSGHVLMYLGLDTDGTAWLLHNTSSGNICKLQTLASYGTSGIIHILNFDTP